MESDLLLKTLGCAERSQPSLKPMHTRTILIADDSALILKVLEARVKSLGCKVVTALDPGEAFEKVRTQQPDLIIMDINFPPDTGFGGGGAWDGFRMLEWMKATQSLGKAIQFIITSDDIEKHRGKAMQAGVAAIFQKPIDARALLNKIRECLPEPTPAT